MPRAEVPGVAAKPPERQTSYDWQALAKWCRRYPGSWRKVFDEDRSSLAQAIRQGSIAALRPHLGFEVRTANNTKDSPRMCTLYVRYDPNREEK